MIADTFSDQNDKKFDNKFKEEMVKKVEDYLNLNPGIDDLIPFTLVDLNIVLKRTKLHSAPGKMQFITKC